MRKEILKAQEGELTGNKIYQFLSSKAKGRNREVLSQIAIDEAKHYTLLKGVTGRDVKSSLLTLFLFKILYYLFGIVFVVKLMERMEEDSIEFYKELSKTDEKFKKVLEEEESHEESLIRLIEEERVYYVSSVVLGLNDALVEITGTISGLSSALQNAKTIGVAALITGIAASLSMAASEYISKKTDILSERNPLKASLYTFIAYFLVVLFLVLPFFFVSNFYVGFVLSVIIGNLVILLFSFYVSVIQDKSFRNTFIEMFVIVIAVVIFTFFIGYLARKMFNVNI